MPGLLLNHNRMMEEQTETITEIPTIAKPKQRNYRKRKLEEDEPDKEAEDGSEAQSVRFGIGTFSLLP